MSVQRRGAVYRDTRHALLKILHEEGVVHQYLSRQVPRGRFSRLWVRAGMRGWFKGCFVTLLGVIPFEGVQFAVYETLREYIIAHRWPHWRWDDQKQTTDSVYVARPSHRVAVYIQQHNY